MILEGIVTTINEGGTTNIAPMGPCVDGTMSRLVLRPFRSCTTYANLKRLGEGVFHVTDDVELLARTAVGPLDQPPELIAADAVNGRILADACRWYAFRVVALDDTSERTKIECTVVDCGRFRDFFGFNRAKHAVIEAAILATRIAILPAENILTEFERLSVIVQKTAGLRERHAFEFLDRYVRRAAHDRADRPVKDHLAR